MKQTHNKTLTVAEQLFLVELEIEWQKFNQNKQMEKRMQTCEKSSGTKCKYGNTNSLLQGMEFLPLFGMAISPQWNFGACNILIMLRRIIFNYFSWIGESLIQ